MERQMNGPTGDDGARIVVIGAGGGGSNAVDRMAAAGVTYRTAGENLALAPTLSLAHTGLMNSPGHRANILHPDFGRVGIGIVDGGLRGLMVTQNFRD